MDQLYSVKLFCMLTLSSSAVRAAGAGCTLRNKTIYVRSEGYYSSQMVQAVVQGVTLSECADQCTSNAQGVNCTSFEYDAVQMKCAQKEGAGNVVDDTLLMGTNNTALFQQLCISEEYICPSPYAFERLPGHVLMGIAREVIKVGMLEECLSLCLASKRSLEIECRSAMYYYDTGECILNGENRATSTALITNDTLSMRVDYFENNCLDVKCPTDSTVHWLKVEGFEISDKHDIFVERVTKEQCISYCNENKIDSQPFPCKLYAYSEGSMTCHLTSESGLMRSATSVPRSTDEQEISEYYEKICLRGLTRCQESSFEHVSNHALWNIANKVITSTSMTRCLEFCLHLDKQCNAVMFFREKDECVLSEKTQYSNPEQFQYFPQVDYFDNVCDYTVNKETFLGTEAAKKRPAPSNKQSDAMNDVRVRGAASLQVTNSLDARVIVEHDALFMDNLELEPIHGRLETECGVDDIAITVRFARPTGGAIFIKDHFTTCRSEFTNTTNITMEIALSTLRQDNPPCPGYETYPSVWSFVVVVQKNDLGIPALMTDADRTFIISCDYSNADIASTSDQDTIFLQEAPLWDGSSATTSNDYVRLAVLRDGQPVSTAVMGEELEMRWTLTPEYLDNVGLFLNRCIAERLDGMAPQPPALTLIDNGCVSEKVSRLLMQHPIVQVDGGLSTKIKVFRFDGSRRVRIVCSVDICAEGCSPVTCGEKVNSDLKNPNKKKRHTLDSLAQQNLDDRVKRQLIAGTFTIVEKPDEITANKTEPKVDEQPLSQNVTQFQLPVNNQICLQEFAFFTLITITAVLSVMQIYVLYNYVRMRTQQSVPSASEGSCSTMSAPQHVYFGREECFCSPEARMTLSRISRLRNAGVIGGGRVLVA